MRNKMLITFIALSLVSICGCDAGNKGNVAKSTKLAQGAHMQYVGNWREDKMEIIGIQLPATMIIRYNKETQTISGEVHGEPMYALGNITFDDSGALLFDIRNPFGGPALVIGSTRGKVVIDPADKNIMRLYMSTMSDKNKFYDRFQTFKKFK